MLRHFTVTTGTVLAITTLSGLAAINQAVTSQRDSHPGRSPESSRRHRQEQPR